ncbi:unnamed protein product, partial [Rotaria sordida]
HHARQELIPLLSVAHMVFNIVTGVDYESEINEIRAFRTVEDWRSCLRRAGFEDTFVYDEQEDDSTDDIMIIFRKPEQDNQITNIEWNENYQKIIANPESNYFRPCERLVVRICMQFGQYLNHTPFYYFPFVKFLVHYWSLFLSETKLSIKKYGLLTILFRSPGFQMNVFVGIFMTITLLPVILSSFLVRIFLSRTIPEYEKLVLEQTENIDEDPFNFQQSIDPHIDHMQILKKERFLCHTTMHSGQFNLHYISDRDDQIQVEILINNDDDAQRLMWLQQQPNIDVIYEFKNPIDNKQTTLIVGVKIKELFSLIRNCTNFESDGSMTIVQIFDYFE